MGVAGTVAAGTAWLSLSAVGLKVLSLVTMVLVLRTLSLYEYGVVELALSILPVMSIFLLPGLQSTVMADMGVEQGLGNKPRMQGLLNAYFRANVLLSIVAWAVLFLFADTIARFYNEHIGMLFKIVSFSLLVSPIRSLYSTLFTVTLHFKERSLIGFLEEASKLALVWGLVIVAGFGIVGMLSAAVLSQMVMLALLTPRYLYLSRKAFGGQAAEQVPLKEVLAAHARWGILATYVGSFTQSARLWIVKLFLGTEAVALFSIAFGLYSHVISLVPISSVIGPMLSHYVHDVRHFARLFIKGAKYQLLLLVPMAVAAFFFGPLLISTLFPAYLSSLPVFNVLLLLVIPLSFDAFFPSLFSALKAQKGLYYAAMYKLALTLIAFPFAAHWLGLPGAAYALVATTILYDLERYRALRRLVPELRIRSSDLFSVDEDDRLILARLGPALRKRVPIFGRDR